jgi:hypothetical protein
MRLRAIPIAALAIGTMILSACGGSSNSIPNAAQAFSSQNLMAPAKAAPVNVIKNPGFETGKMAPWKAIGANPGAPKVVSSKWHTGKWSAFMGTSAPPAVKGLHGISQSVKVPADGKLTFWFSGASNDQIKYGDQEVDVEIGGKIVDTCYKELITNTAWKEGKCSLTKYANQTITLVFGVYDNGYSKSFVDWFIDDVSLT